MRFGILGGTFDPPHNGHLALARAALSQLELDEVIFLPANRNPQKSQKVHASAKQRMAMVGAMIDQEPKMSYSDMEITRGGSSYTVDTLAELQMVQPAEYWFLLGADALRSIDTWKSPSRLIKLCRLGVAIRPPINVTDVITRLPDEFRERVDIVNMSAQEVSSTDIRDRVYRGQNISPWVSPGVLQYIQTQKLYRNA